MAELPILDLLCWVRELCFRAFNAFGDAPRRQPPGGCVSAGIPKQGWWSPPATGRVRADVWQALQRELPVGYAKPAAGKERQAAASSGKWDCPAPGAGSYTSTGASLAWIKLSRSQVKKPQEQWSGKGRRGLDHCGAGEKLDAQETAMGWIHDPGAKSVWSQRELPSEQRTCHGMLYIRGKTRARASSNWPLK